MKPGTPLLTPYFDGFPQARIATLDPRGACSEILRAYLLCSRFQRTGGDVADTGFVLKAVEAVWPEAGKELDFPTASVIEMPPVVNDRHSFTPTCLDDTFGRFGENTVLWKTEEVLCDFQVDFWCNEDPTREAIAAQLPALFSPGENRRGVMLSGEPRYYEVPMRATLVDYPSRVDNSEDVLQRERRLMAHIRCEIDSVHLRKATLIRPRIVLTVKDTADECVEPEVVRPSHSR